MFVHSFPLMVRGRAEANLKVEASPGGGKPQCIFVFESRLKEHYVPYYGITHQHSDDVR